MRLSKAALLCMGALAAAVPAGAQQADTLPPPMVYAGIQGVYARPVGEFSEYVKHGGGLDVNIVWPVSAGGPFALRADGGFIVYGSERKEVCFSSTVGCRVRLNLTTTNSIAYLNAGPQLMVPFGPVRPYANAGVGFSYFSTTSEVDGTDSQSGSIASTTNFDDITFTWVGGGGVLIPVWRGSTPVLIDVGARYVGNGQVEYLKKGDIQDNPDGSITYTPTRSEANLMQYHIGVTIGVRRRGQ